MKMILESLLSAAGMSTEGCVTLMFSTDRGPLWERGGGLTFVGTTMLGSGLWGFRILLDCRLSQTVETRHVL